MDSTKKARFDGTINLGHVLTIVALAGSVFAMYFADRVTITEINTRLAAVETQTAKISEAVVVLARQDERLNNYEGRISRLESRTTRLEDRLEPGMKSGPR